MAKKGSAKQDLFVASYIKHLSENDPCKRASDESGLSYDYCRQLLTFPHIVAKIDDAKLERCKKTGVDAHMVLTHLAQMMEADIADILGEDGAFRPLREWPKIWRQMLNGVDVQEVYGNYSGDEKEMVGLLKKVKFLDRMRVIDLIGKHISVQAFKERVEVSADKSLADALIAARRRVETS